jgi:hypothetical protein
MQYAINQKDADAELNIRRPVDKSFTESSATRRSPEI